MDKRNDYSAQARFGRHTGASIPARNRTSSAQRTHMNKRATDTWSAATLMGFSAFACAASVAAALEARL